MNEMSRNSNTTVTLNAVSGLLSTDLPTKIADLKALFFTAPDADVFVWIGYMGTIVCVFITAVIFYFDFILPAIAFAGRGLSSYSFGRLGQDLGLLARVADSSSYIIKYDHAMDLPLTPEGDCLRKTTITTTQQQLRQLSNSYGNSPATLKVTPHAVLYCVYFCSFMFLRCIQCLSVYSVMTMK
ncbi:uncharacterized protein [Macrobrachium rosenbergii]|uniref:uncharacterized protein isoform X1 n=1 Tax=Macrobrachium rosenbergii TaxID=79674 RepID=UPI0034D6CBB2